MINLGMLTRVVSGGEHKVDRMSGRSRVVLKKVIDETNSLKPVM